jgi:hypothetical protein
MSPKQRELLERLVVERRVPLRYRGLIDEALWGFRDLSPGATAGLIGMLLKAPRK